MDLRLFDSVQSNLPIRPESPSFSFPSLWPFCGISLTLFSFFSFLSLSLSPFSFSSSLPTPLTYTHLPAPNPLIPHSTTERNRLTMLRPILLLALLALLILYFRQPHSNSSPIHSKTVKTFLKQQHQQQPPKNGRTVAVGDLHSDLAQTLAVLRLANVIDADSNWSGGHDTLVQTVSRRRCRGYRCIIFFLFLSLSH